MEWIVNQKKEALLFDIDEGLLQDYFVKIDAGLWAKLFQLMPIGDARELLEKTANGISLPVLEKMIAVLAMLSKEKAFYGLVSNHFDTLPQSFEQLYGKQSKRVRKDALSHLFALDKTLSPADEKVNELAQAMFVDPEHSDICGVLIPSLLTTKTPTKLMGRLLDLSEGYLQNRVDNKPQPPADWVRPIPKTTSYQSQWDMLKDFLNSPDEQVFDFRKVQHERKLMEEAIRSVTIDLKMETIKKGSPHLLRITKTQDAYKRELKIWEKDVQLLEKVKNYRSS